MKGSWFKASPVRRASVRSKLLRVEILEELLKPEEPIVVCIKLMTPGEEVGRVYVGNDIAREDPNWPRLIAREITPEEFERLHYVVS